MGPVAGMRAARATHGSRASACAARVRGGNTWLRERRTNGSAPPNKDTAINVSSIIRDGAFCHANSPIPQNNQVKAALKNEKFPLFSSNSRLQLENQFIFVTFFSINYV